MMDGIIIEKDIINLLGQEIKQIYTNNYTNHKIAIITDENIDRLYGEKIIKSLKLYNFETIKIVINAGEESKSLKTLEYLYSILIRNGVTRNDLLIAFGGGVVGDLTGFCAATLYRGISYIQVPTTLLAQIDSAIGGKTGINLKEGKNLAGSFYKPQKVIIDPNLLKTLSERNFKNGIAEIIKYGIICAGKLFSILENNKKSFSNNLEFIIKNCVQIKTEIVRADEFDNNGVRICLNFGHTFGHAIEAYYKYSQKYLHGEAVAIGMYIISKIGVQLNVTSTECFNRIKNLLILYGFDIELDIPLKKLLKFIKNDKKNISKSLNLVFASKIGQYEVKEFTIEEISEILEKIWKFVFL